MNLIVVLAGVCLSAAVIFFNLRIVLLGLKEYDPLEHMESITKIAFPAAFFELIYLFWVYLVLPGRMIYFLLIISLLSLIYKTTKYTGYKFAVYVLAPATECLVILYGLFLLWQNKFN